MVRPAGLALTCTQVFVFELKNYLHWREDALYLRIVILFCAGHCNWRLPTECPKVANKDADCVVTLGFWVYVEENKVIDMRFNRDCDFKPGC